MILGTGIDIVEVASIRRSLEKFGERFLRRILRPDEIAYCMAHKCPEVYVAARFAAKEAISKHSALEWGQKLGSRTSRSDAKKRANRSSFYTAMGRNSCDSAAQARFI